MSKWKNITKKLPPNGEDVLVWTGLYTFVATAEVYTEEEITQRLKWADEVKSPLADSFRQHFLTAKGQFKDVGVTVYFNDPKVYWMELPKRPESK